MDFFTNIVTVFTKSLDFDGKASRKEFWYYQLYLCLLFLLVDLIYSFIDTRSDFTFWNAIISWVFLIECVPNIALGVRRLHDIGKSGWLMLFNFLPVVGQVFLTYLFISKPVVSETVPS